MDFEIADRHDIEGILEISKQLGNNICPLEEAENIWDVVEKSNIKYFVAKENTKIVGSLYICIIPNLTQNGKSIGFIENVITDENYRGKGIGKKLMDMATQYAKENNCYKVVLQSGIKRTQAHKFYEKIGFDGESKRAYELRF